jgi:hypothetical protein
VQIWDSPENLTNEQHLVKHPRNLERRLTGSIAKYEHKTNHYGQGRDYGARKPERHYVEIQICDKRGEHSMHNNRQDYVIVDGSLRDAQNQRPLKSQYKFIQ